MVKVTDGEIAADFGIMTTPTLAYFRRGHALIYEGDLMDAASILGWITSNEAFQLKDEIELVNRRMLDKILDEQEFVAVYFCKYYNCNKVISNPAKRLLIQLTLFPRRQRSRRMSNLFCNSDRVRAH